MLTRITTSFFSIILLSIIAYPSAFADSCLQMMNSHWKGTYKWTYRGDNYQLPMSSNTVLVSPHKYIMYVQLQNTSPPYNNLTLTGTCMYSQIYLEDLAIHSPIYLQGTINSFAINLSGNRGPDVVSINLKKQIQ